MKSGLIISNHEHMIYNKDLVYQNNHKLMIWNQDLLYQIINTRFEMRIYYIKSQMHDLKI